MLGRGGIRVNNERIRQSGAPLGRGDVVVAHVLSREREPGATRLDDSRVLLVDQRLIAVDKPAGLPAQETQADASGGLDEVVRAWLVARGEQAQLVGVVHRLDVESSGVTLFGRTADAVRDLSEQFRLGSIDKRYRLLVGGHPSWDSRDVDQPIATGNRPGSFATSPRGRPARTSFRVLSRFGSESARSAATLLEAHPLTGRTHQIRVHAAYLGFPLLGDRRYGGAEALTTSSGARIEIPRVALHASSLAFRHPVRGQMTLEAPWPNDLSDTEQRLRTAS